MALTAEEAAYFQSGGKDTRAIGAAEATEAPPAAVETEQVVDQPVTQEAAPETDNAVVDDEDEGHEGPIPYQRFKKEREKWKARVEAEAKTTAELREWKARLEERLNFAQQNAQQPAQAEPQKAEEPPPPEEDIFAHLEWQKKQIAALQDQLKQGSQQSERARQYEAWKQRIGAEEKAFEAKTPDYTKAIDFLKTSRIAELKDVFGLNPDNPAHVAAIMQDLDRQASSLAAAAHQRGMSAAEMAYNMAKARGYRAQALAAAPEVSDAKKDEARAASKTLSGTGGTPSGFKTLEDLAAMTPAQFADYRKKHPEVVRKMMGG